MNEDALKSNYILRFKDFVHWDRSEKSPITIGVIGENALESLSSFVEERNTKSGQEVFKVIPVNTPDQTDETDILYFAEDFDEKYKTYLEKARAQGILTIANGSKFLEAGCLISFEIRKNRLHFRLNFEAGEAYGIKFSSKLAKLASG